MTRRAVLLSLVAAIRPATAQPAAEVTGRVFDASTKEGIPNLQVKLTPPRQSRAAIRLTQTARDGTFTVSRVTRGRYLLEVALGATLLYRAEVDTADRTRFDIPLRRR